MTIERRFVTVLAAASVIFLTTADASAHCDRLDGPVVKAAREALAARDAAPALVWVQEKDEPEVRAAFERTLKVRALGGDAKDLADRYFFETLVRLHRAGEGEPFTGLKPAGDPGPAIGAADTAVSTASLEPLIKMIVAAAERGLRERFAAVVRTKATAASDVKSGRAHVAAYVAFVHYVEQLHAALGGPSAGHHEH